MTPSPDPVSEAREAMTPQEVAEYAVWYARKVPGPASTVAAALLLEVPWLREPLQAASPAGPEGLRAIADSIDGHCPYCEGTRRMTKTMWEGETDIGDEDVDCLGSLHGLADRLRAATPAPDTGAEERLRAALDYGESRETLTAAEVRERETADEVRRFELVETYIRGLQWSVDVPETVRTIVAGNLRGFAAWLAATPAPDSGAEERLRVALPDGWKPLIGREPGGWWATASEPRSNLGRYRIVSTSKNGVLYPTMVEAIDALIAALSGGSVDEEGG